MNRTLAGRYCALAVLVLFVWTPTGAWAAEPVRLGDPKSINAGDTAWVLVSTALVLMMTGPGLLLFYGGLLRRRTSSPP